MKRRYRVFVSYHFQGHDGRTGVGYTNLSLTAWKSRFSHADITKFRQHIIDTNDYENVVILNYQIM